MWIFDISKIHLHISSYQVLKLAFSFQHSSFQTLSHSDKTYSMDLDRDENTEVFLVNPVWIYICVWASFMQEPCATHWQVSSCSLSVVLRDSDTLDDVCARTGTTNGGTFQSRVQKLITIVLPLQKSHINQRWGGGFRGKFKNIKIQYK